MINFSEYILDALYQEGVEYFFMVPGKLINPFMCCYTKVCQKNITPIVAAHECGAGYMADGYARASGHFGVFLVIDGPGSVNAVSAIAAAYADGSPVLMIAGQIPKNYEMMGAIQDCTQSGIDTRAIMKPITAASYQVRDSAMLERYFRNTLKCMMGFQQKPAYLGIAKDVLLEKTTSKYRKINNELSFPKICDANVISNLCETVLKNTSKICILVGRKAKTHEVNEQLILIAEKYNIPIATTLSAKGVFPEDHYCSLGVFGYAGHIAAIDTILSDDIETLILLGFDVTQWTTLVWNEKIKPTKALVQVDKDITQIDQYIEVDYPVVSDPGEFLKQMIKFGDIHLTQSAFARKDWCARLSLLPKHYDQENCLVDRMPIHPARLIKKMRDVFPRNTILLADSGTHRAFAAHYWEAYSPLSFFSNTTLAPMGWAIPASIGVSLAQPNNPCVVVTGDGCMLMYGTEIQTAARHNLKIIYIVINNSYYAATYFNNKNNLKRLSSLPTHNWCEFAKSLGLEAAIVFRPEEITNALEVAQNSENAYLIDVRCGHTYPTPVPLYKEAIRKSEAL